MLETKPLPLQERHRLAVFLKSNNERVRGESVIVETIRAAVSAMSNNVELSENSDEPRFNATTGTSRDDENVEYFHDAVLDSDFNNE